MRLMGGRAPSWGEGRGEEARAAEHDGTWAMYSKGNNAGHLVGGPRGSREGQLELGAWSFYFDQPQHRRSTTGYYSVLYSVLLYTVDIDTTSDGLGFDPDDFCRCCYSAVE